MPTVATIEHTAPMTTRRTWQRLGWFVALWAAGVAVLAGVAALIRLALGA